MTARKKVVKLRKNHPEWTLLQIGKETGISFPRVFQILATEKPPLVTKSVRPYRPPQKCKYCGSETKPLRFFCSNGVCRENYYFLIIPCFYCYKPIRKRRSVYRVLLSLNQTRFYHDWTCVLLDKQTRSRKNRPSKKKPTFPVLFLRPVQERSKGEV